MDPNKGVDFLVANWETLKAAPLIFVTLVTGAFGFGAFVVNWVKAEQIAAKDSQIALFKERAGEYERKLKVASPDEARARNSIASNDAANQTPHPARRITISRLNP